MEFKNATKVHVDGILDIYAPIIETSHTSFEYQVPASDDMWLRIQNVQKHYPWLVAERNEKVLGYAYATRFRGRKAYDWVCETSIYVHPDQFGQNVAMPLYELLFSKLYALGMHQLIAGIALPNDRSIAFHEKCGFRSIGTFKEIGYKGGKWVDVGFWQKELVPGLPK